MQHSTRQEPMKVTFHDPVTDSMVRLEGSLKFESLEGRFPSTVPGVKSSLPRPERIGPYVIEAELGRGGMGVVYKAFDTRLQRTVALKVILRADYSEAKDLHRFQVEATAVAKLQHPNIVQVFDVGTEKDVPFMALEFIEQGTLHRKTQGKPQEPRYSAYMVAGMADGIQHAHDHGILHRDLKPANILVRRREGDSSASGSVDTVAAQFTDVPVVSDFGLAKKLDSNEMYTQSGMAVGTPNYMAPEQASGMKQQVGTAADIYGLGAILYELLTGRPPFQGVNPVETMLQVMSLDTVPPRQLQPKVPVDLETICLKCLHKEPEKRYATAADLAADLRRFLGNQVILARPAGRGERLVRWCRRHPAVTTLLGLIFVLLLAGAGVATFFAIDANQRAIQLAEEKEKAARNLQRARIIIREYLTGVDDDPALHDMLSVPLKQKLLSKAMPILKELLQEGGDTPELLAEQAKAHWLLGNIHSLIGQTKDAETAYHDSIATWKKLLALEPSNRHLELLGTSYLNLSLLQIKQGQYDEAIATIQHTQDVAKSMPDEPNNDAKLIMQVRALVNLAGLHRVRGNVKQAVLEHQEIAKLTDKPKAFANQQNEMEHRSLALLERALLEVDTGRLTEALATYTEADKLVKDLGDKINDPNRRELTQARIAHQMGVTEQHLGHFEAADRHYQRAITQMQQVIAASPHSHTYQLNLATSLGGRGMNRIALGKSHEAEEDLLAQQRLLEQLAKVNPTYANRRELARANSQLGNFYFESQQPKKGEAALREAGKQYAEVLPLQPGDIETRRMAANSRMTLGNVLLAQMRFKDSIEEYRAAQDRFAEMAALCPEQPINFILQAGANCNLSRGCMGLKEYDQAHDHAQTAQTLLQKALAMEPRHAVALQFLRNTKLTLGELHLDQGHTQEAVKFLNEVMQSAINANERVFVNQLVERAHGRLLEEAREAAEAKRWGAFTEIAELFAHSAEVKNSHYVEMLPLCSRGLQAGKLPALEAATVTLAQKLASSGYLSEVAKRQSLASEAPALLTLPGLRKILQPE